MDNIKLPESLECKKHFKQSALFTFKRSQCIYFLNVFSVTKSYTFELLIFLWVSFQGFGKGIANVAFGLDMVCYKRPCPLQILILYFIHWILAVQNLSCGYYFYFSHLQTSSASLRFAYQVTSKLFPSPFDLSAASHLPLPAGHLPCPTGLPAILLIRLEFSHSVACVLFFFQSAIFSSESLLGRSIKISGKVLSSW